MKNIEQFDNDEVSLVDLYFRLPSGYAEAALERLNEVYFIAEEKFRTKSISAGLGVGWRWAEHEFDFWSEVCQCLNNGKKLPQKISTPIYHRRTVDFWLSKCLPTAYRDYLRRKLNIPGPVQAPAMNSALIELTSYAPNGVTLRRDDKLRIFVEGLKRYFTNKETDIPDLPEDAKISRPKNAPAEVEKLVSPETLPKPETKHQTLQNAMQNAIPQSASYPNIGSVWLYCFPGTSSTHRIRILGVSDSFVIFKHDVPLRVFSRARLMPYSQWRDGLKSELGGAANANVIHIHAPRRFRPIRTLVKYGAITSIAMLIGPKPLYALVSTVTAWVSQFLSQQ